MLGNESCMSMFMLMPWIEMHRKWADTEIMLDSIRQQFLAALSKANTKVQETEIKYQAEKRKAEVLDEQLKNEREVRRRIETTSEQHSACIHQCCACDGVNGDVMSAVQCEGDAAVNNNATDA